jgi:uncharacterized membrane protein YcaP (DUF421 family)
MLLYRGQVLSAALRRARVTEDEVRAAVRAAGLASLSDVEAVVLETDGLVQRGPRRGGERPAESRWRPRAARKPRSR